MWAPSERGVKHSNEREALVFKVLILKQLLALNFFRLHEPLVIYKSLRQSLKSAVKTLGLQITEQFAPEKKDFLDF